MRKELKQILLICLFLIIGCVLGYFVALVIGTVISALLLGILKKKVV